MSRPDFPSRSGRWAMLALAGVLLIATAGWTRGAPRTQTPGAHRYQISARGAPADAPEETFEPLEDAPPALLPVPLREAWHWYFFECGMGEVHSQQAILDRVRESRAGRALTEKEEAWERETEDRIEHPPFGDRLCVTLTDYGVGASAYDLLCPDGHRSEVHSYPSRRQYREACGTEQEGTLEFEIVEPGVTVLRDRH